MEGPGGETAGLRGDMSHSKSRRRMALFVFQGWEGRGIQGKGMLQERGGPNIGVFGGMGACRTMVYLLVIYKVLVEVI